MKTLNFYLYLFLTSLLCIQCKSKDASNSPLDHDHIHFYRVYIGKITDVVRSDDPSVKLGTCIFNGEPHRFIIGSDLDVVLKNNDLTFEYKVYKLQVGVTNPAASGEFPPGNDILILYNEVLQNNFEDSLSIEGAPNLKGNLGCVPKLIFIEDELLVSKIDKTNYLLLPAVIHNDLTSQIADFLKLYAFKISDTNLDKIKESIRSYSGKKENLEVGLDKSEQHGKITLTIYEPNSKNGLITVEMEK